MASFFEAARRPPSAADRAVTRVGPGEPTRFRHPMVALRHDSGAAPAPQKTLAQYSKRGYSTRLNCVHVRSENYLKSTEHSCSMCRISAEITSNENIKKITGQRAEGRPSINREKRGLGNT